MPEPAQKVNGNWRAHFKLPRAHIGTYFLRHRREMQTRNLNFSAEDFLHPCIGSGGNAVIKSPQAQTKPKICRDHRLDQAGVLDPRQD